ncbi:MAG: hypothetical protein IRZ16_04795 [Myxococcaceae bacterium]|nr:hypothetical protein [Myxococcaceae bacterium]
MEANENQGNGHAVDGGFGQRLDQIGEDARRFVDDAKGAVSQLSSALDLRGRVERHPYGMVLAAFGVGYVLGGGLFTPTTARLLRLAMKLAALPLVKDELIGMAEAAVDGFAHRGGGAGAPGSAPYNPQGGS